MAPNSIMSDEAGLSLEDSSSETKSLGGVSKTSTYYTGGESFIESDSNSENGEVARPEYIDPVLAEKEEKAAFWSRLVVIVILSVAVALMATAMYLLISGNEKADFENQVSAGNESKRQLHHYLPQKNSHNMKTHPTLLVQQLCL
jgi:hypothetical protein